MQVQLRNDIAFVNVNSELHKSQPTNRDFFIRLLNLCCRFAFNLAHRLNLLISPNFLQNEMNCFENFNSEGFCLLPEIWSHIFSFLKVNDRKNVRLTCSRWYHACNTIPLLRSEKIYINSAKNKRDVSFDALMNSSRLSFNFVFIFLGNFPPNGAEFWRKVGPRVEELKLIDSMNEKEFWGQMMKFCSNLKKLHIVQRGDLIRANDFLVNWNEPGIGHESLECLVLEDCPFLTDFHFSRLFDIYPSIRRLEFINTKVNCDKHVNSRLYQSNSQYNADSIFSSSCVIANIKLKAENIKSLNLKIFDCCDYQDNFFQELSSLPGLKLKELKLDWSAHVTEEAFMKFFGNQTCLEFIEIDHCCGFSTKCFLHMIRNCFNLKDIRVFCLDANYDSSMGKEIHHVLRLLPCLKKLKLRGVFFMPKNADVNGAAPVSTTAFPFQRLRELTLHVPASHFEIFFPETLPNLTTLCLFSSSGKGLTDANLQLIFHKMIHLQTLKLSLDSSVSDFGFCGMKSPENQVENSGISINRLKRLEKLVLMCDKDLGNSITCASVSHFVSLKLRKLKLIHFPRITENIFELICQNTPFMEYCEFRECEIEDKALTRFETGWSSLLYVHKEKSSNHYWQSLIGLRNWYFRHADSC